MRCFLQYLEPEIIVDAFVPEILRMFLRSEMAIVQVVFQIFELVWNVLTFCVLVFEIWPKLEKGLAMYCCAACGNVWISGLVGVYQNFTGYGFRNVLVR